ncbi:MAG: carboxymuconolactone decarboxylase [Rhodospirillaceae bacterium]|nr:carboxymuconolactone decarboxylase [Rhodospirillaceae bacterium]|tara:strand:- start:1749 stop:2276 length:528 start_codon:yes stop_codon:yes gene_type:complete
MARVSLVDAEGKPELAEFVENLKAGRRGKLLNIYKMLLHNPPAAKGWFDYLNMVRWELGLDGRIRELVIIRIAYFNRVQYVINQHVPELAEAEGLTLAECDALSDWENSDLFDEKDRAILAYTDSMSRDIQVPDEIYDAVAAYFDEAGIVGLTVLIGTYNMHTRIFQALDIDLEK